MRLRFSEASFSAPAILMATPGGYPPSSPGYQAPPPGGYVPPPSAGQPAGLSSNAASVLAYLFGIISGIVFLVLEPYKRDSFVRFNAFQSIFLGVGAFVVFFAWTLISILLSMVSHGLFGVVALLVNLALSLGFFVVWIMLMVRASQGRKWVLPVIGPLAEKQAGSVSF